jgi:glycosyltransferase involved in cell wall biosynthesis
MNKVAVVLPAYNEEQTIRATIEAFHTELPSAAIWVINNRSSDATESIAAETIGRLNCTGGVISEPRPGKGNAVRRAFLEIDADAYVLVDSDMTYPADQVSDLLIPILKNNADMVVGDRHSAGHYASENKRLFHGLGNKLPVGRSNSPISGQVKLPHLNGL